MVQLLVVSEHLLLSVLTLPYSRVLARGTWSPVRNIWAPAPSEFFKVVKKTSSEGRKETTLAQGGPLCPHTPQLPAIVSCSRCWWQPPSC